MTDGGDGSRAQRRWCFWMGSGRGSRRVAAPQATAVHEQQGQLAVLCIAGAAAEEEAEQRRQHEGELAAAASWDAGRGHEVPG
ncbi:hypothetical protein E2562_022816 [Oryza meyeriana var. granulata]|uniref:Uncharacterized protein n=1 Tax=Oryza meyeriana var. granulata TaxID=110450 RepID=A0A6G1FAY7_9ORYZ|nr:hypothetical protein E2562_022816 [Oryza meyeriana var. granulata]